MKIYKNTYTGEPGDPDINTGASWHASKREAAKAARQCGTPYELDGVTVHRAASTEPVTFEPTRAGIIRLLTQHATDPSNG